MDEEELRLAYERCKGRDDGRDKITGWITGTFYGLEDSINLEKYPILAKLLERPLFRNIFLRILRNI